MSWRYREPIPSDYDSEEDYEVALRAYENALDDYCSELEESRC